VPTSPSPLRRRRVTVAVAAVVVLGGGATYLVARGSGPSTTVTARSPIRSGRRSQRHPSRDAGKAISTTVGGLEVESISPDNGTTGAGSMAPITIEFSSTISTRSVMPTLAPSVPGSWRISGRTITITPNEPFVPLSQVTLTVPGGSGGVRARGGTTLATTVVDKFDIEDGSTIRLQQLLSLLDYSPLSWSPSGGAILAGDMAGRLSAMYSPPPGNFAWRSPSWPPSLTSLWQPGSCNVFTRGLVMSFQADHGLIVNGH
jgi:hypothetical protein